jgi:TPP-dependent 2-oxoacid decarboxylase
MVGFNQCAWVFKFVHGNGKVFADATSRAKFREDESVEVVSNLCLNNFWSVQDGTTPGTSVVLDPGSSYYQNVNVNLAVGGAIRMEGLWISIFWLPN